MLFSFLDLNIVLLDNIIFVFKRMNNGQARYDAADTLIR